MFGMWDAVMAMIIKKSPIKSIQSGATAGSGNVTINAVNVSKTMVLSKSKGSTGTVAATGDIFVPVQDYPGNTLQSYNSGAGDLVWKWGTGRLGYITNGTTNLTTKEYSAKLINSTTISCDGPVEWQVIEFV